MLTRQRKQLILDRLVRDGQIVASDLSRELSISEDTIRRDLRELSREGLLQRVHGGALPASPAIASLDVRATISTGEKAALGRAAAALIEPGQVALVDGGTTALELVQALSRDLRATIVTHSPVIAASLISHPHIEVVILGGRLFKHSGVAMGAATVDAVSRIRADIYFMGVTGLHPTHGLTTGDMEESYIKRALRAAAAECVVMASSEKLNAASPFLIAPMHEATTLILPGDCDPAFVAACRDKSVEVILARVN